MNSENAAPSENRAAWGRTPTPLVSRNERPAPTSEPEMPTQAPEVPLNLESFPFKVDTDFAPRRLVPKISEGGGTEFEVWEFHSNGESYVYKVLKDDARNSEPGKLSEFIQKKRLAYSIFKEYLGDYLTPTYFIIA